MADVFDGPLTASDPWAHIRAHAAQGGLYACAIEQLLNRVQALEARPEVQVLPTTPQEGGPTVLAPIQLQQGGLTQKGLAGTVQKAISDVEFPHGNDEASAAILAVAEWFDSIGYGATASILRQEVVRG